MQKHQAPHSPTPTKTNTICNSEIQKLVIQSQKAFDALWDTPPEVIDYDVAILEIQTKIESLPPLPASIFEIEKIRTSDSSTNEDLLKIIQQDPMVTANVLKVANSAMFGFSSQIKNPKVALNMLGFNMVCSIAISTAIRKTIPANFDAYGLTPEAFSTISATQSAIIAKWKDRKLTPHRNELALAALLQEIGKMIISLTLKEKGKQNDFKLLVSRELDPSPIEKRYTAMSACQISSMIFKHWKLNPSLVEIIALSDNPETIEDEQKKTQAYALKVSRLLCPAVYGKRFSDINRDLAVTLCEEAGLDIGGLDQVIENITSQEALEKQKK